MDKYKVTLTADERQELEELIGKGKAAARKLTHASRSRNMDCSRVLRIASGLL